MKARGGSKQDHKRVWAYLPADIEAKVTVLQLALEVDRDEVFKRALEFYWRAMAKENVLIALLRDDALARGGR